MSNLSSGGSMGTPEIYSSGQSNLNYEQLFALFHDVGLPEDRDEWLPSIEDEIRKPQLGGDSYEVEEPDAMLHLTNPEIDWKAMAGFLFAYLQHARECWLHPLSIYGKPSLVEHHSGTVSRILGEYVSVCFGTGENQFEAEYAKSHFHDPSLIVRGDQIDAVIGLWHRKPHANRLDHIVSPEEQQKLDADWESGKSLTRGDLDL